MTKIGLLTSQTLSDFNLEALKPILRDDNYSIKIALVDSTPKKSLKQKWKKNLKRGRGGYMFIMAIKAFLSKKKQSISTEAFCINKNIPLLETTNPYSNEIIEKIKGLNLDILILLGGYGIIKKTLLEIPGIGVLSYHHGDMRKYRGMPPALWELYNNEEEMGITVQLLSTGLDRGIPVEEKFIKIVKNDNVKTLRNRAYFESTPMLYDALNKLSDKKFIPNEITKFGEVYTLPNFKQWVFLQVKMIKRLF